MATTEPQQFCIRSGERLTVRTAEESDAAALIAHARAVLRDAPYVVTRPEEFVMSEQEERLWVRRHCESPTGIALVAEAGEKAQLTGVLFAQPQSRRRLAHRCNIHVSVARAWRRRGVGTALLQTAVAWAREEPAVEILNLEVLSPNAAALGLYRKLGFAEDGRRARGIKLGQGEYADELLMSLSVNASPSE